MNLHKTALLTALMIVLGATIGHAQPLQPLFSESFDDGELEGVVGKAGNQLNANAAGRLNIERGTMAFFVRVENAPGDRAFGGNVWQWGLGGIDQALGEGYYFRVLAFDATRNDFGFALFDAGRYAPPLPFDPAHQTWDPDKWYHLAAVWDRNQGITVYRDGQVVADNWGEYSWQWNLQPRNFALTAHRKLGVSFDEVRVFGEPLTAAQVKQLANKHMPTGQTLPVATGEAWRAAELARMGWSGNSLQALPRVGNGQNAQFKFQQIKQCIDANRPQSQLFDGMHNTTWPQLYYLSFTKGRQLDITLHDLPGPEYDRIRYYVQRSFVGQLSFQNTADLPPLTIHTEQAAIVHQQLDGPQTTRRLQLQRTQGQLGRLDLYHVAIGNDADSGADESTSYLFDRLESFDDNDLGDHLQIATPLRFQRPIRATDTSPDSWTQETPAFGGFQAATTGLSTTHGYTGVELILVAEQMTGPTPVRITITEPVDSRKEWLVLDTVLVPEGEGRQQFKLRATGRPVINLPAMALMEQRSRRKPAERIESQGVGFGISVVAGEPVTWAMGKGGSVFTPVQVPIDSVIQEAAEDQIEFMRQGFSVLMEVHHYGDPRIQIPLTWLATFAPERKEFQQMARRARVIRSPEGFEPIETEGADEPTEPASAPAWARWQRDAMQKYLSMLHWRINNSRLPTGEFGSTFNDDTTLLENWLGYALAIDNDQGEIKQALRSFWNGLWKYSLDRGASRYATDLTHYSEEGSSSMGMQLLIDYGDPVAFERAMAAAENARTYITNTPEGYRFQEGFLGSRNLLATGEEKVPAFSHAWDPLVPAGYLIWYCQYPEAVKTYQGLLDASIPEWREMAPINFHHYAALSGLGEDKLKALAEAASEQGPQGHWRTRMQQEVYGLNLIGPTPAVAKRYSPPFAPGKPFVQAEIFLGLQRWLHWRASGDERYLIDGYRLTCEWFNNYDWLVTEARPAHDRIRSPRTVLVASRLGGRVANRGSSGLMWPQHAVSYTHGAQETAALVTTNLPDQLNARFYPFTEKEHELHMRVWRLQPGTYRVVLQSENEGDSPIMDEERELDRGAELMLRLPAGVTSHFSITPVNIRPANFAKPDLAISLDTVDVVYNRHLVVKVHNLGAVAAEDVVIRVRDKVTGRILPAGERRIARIDAPRNYQPSFVRVQFDDIYTQSRGMLIEIDPDKEIDEVNPDNNRLILTDAHILGPAAIGAERQAER